LRRAKSRSGEGKFDDNPEVTRGQENSALVEQNSRRDSNYRKAVSSSVWLILRLRLIYTLRVPPSVMLKLRFRQRSVCLTKNSFAVPCCVSDYWQFIILGSINKLRCNLSISPNYSRGRHSLRSAWPKSSRSS